jgi:hypothetical protein
MSVLHRDQPNPYRDSEKGSLTASEADQAVLGGSRGFRPHDGDVVRDPSLEVQCTAEKHRSGRLACPTGAGFGNSHQFMGFIPVFPFTIAITAIPPIDTDSAKRTG